MPVLSVFGAEVEEEPKALSLVHYCSSLCEEKYRLEEGHKYSSLLWGAILEHNIQLSLYINTIAALQPQELRPRNKN